MLIDIKYKRLVNFIGRNGMFKQSGISVVQHDRKNVSLIPFTSKNVIGNCFVEIPLEDVPSVIAALKKVTAQKQNLTIPKTVS